MTRKIGVRGVVSPPHTYVLDQCFVKDESFFRYPGYYTLDKA